LAALLAGIQANFNPAHLKDIETLFTLWGGYVIGIIPGLIAVVCIGLSVWTFIQSNGGKPNPVKLTWLQLGLPGAVLLIMLLFPGLSYGAAGVLGVWAVISFIVWLVKRSK
jgi:hypothetical protein